MSRRSGRQIVVSSLLATGVVSIAAGIALAIVVDPLLALIALAGAFDLVLAWAFATERLGDGAVGESEQPASADPLQDPSYNPYARED